MEQDKSPNYCNDDHSLASREDDASFSINDGIQEEAMCNTSTPAGVVSQRNSAFRVVMPPRVERLYLSYQSGNFPGQFGSFSSPNTQAESHVATPYSHQYFGIPGTSRSVPGMYGPHQCYQGNASSCYRGEPAVKRKEHREIPQCTICKKVFSRKSTLKVHMLIHYNIKPFQCEYCGRRFSQMGNMVTHTRIHTGIKPYQCDTCGKAFTQYSSHRAHIKIHEREANKDPSV